MNFLHLTLAKKIVTGFVNFTSSSQLKDLIRSGKFRRACSDVVNIVQPPNRVFTTERLQNLRYLMRNTSFTKDQRLLDAYIVPSQDEHQVSNTNLLKKKLVFFPPLE